MTSATGSTSLQSDGAAALNGSMHQPRSVGLQLNLDAAAKVRMESFLLSSDLQWHLQGPIHSPATPLGRLFPELLPAPQPALAGRHWNGAQQRLHVQADATPVQCSASGETLVVSHRALPEHLPLVPMEHQMAAPPFVVVNDAPLLIQPIEPDAPVVRNGKNVEAAALVAA